MAFDMMSALLIGFANLYFFTLFIYIVSKFYLQHTSLNFFYVAFKGVFERKHVSLEVTTMINLNSTDKKSRSNNMLSPDTKKRKMSNPGPSSSNRFYLQDTTQREK